MQEHLVQLFSLLLILSGWAAPEQVLRREIGPATDVYPL